MRAALVLSCVNPHSLVHRQSWKNKLSTQKTKVGDKLFFKRYNQMDYSRVLVKWFFGPFGLRALLEIVNLEKPQMALFVTALLHMLILM